MIALAAFPWSPVTAEIIGMPVARMATEEEMKASLAKIELEDVNGSRLSLGNIIQNGKPTLITLWANWCANCRAEMADYKRIAATCPDQWNMVFVSSRTSDFPKDLAKIRSYVLPWKIYHVVETVSADKERNRIASAFYGATRAGEVITPLHYLISSSGHVDAIVNARMNFSEPKKLAAFCR
jgi:thiol-disulfide isomerase/thioredoxin